MALEPSDMEDRLWRGHYLTDGARNMSQRMRNQLGPEVEKQTWKNGSFQTILNFMQEAKRRPRRCPTGSSKAGSLRKGHEAGGQEATSNSRLQGHTHTPKC